MLANPATNRPCILSDDVPEDVIQAAHWWLDWGLAVAPMDQATKHTRLKWVEWLPQLERDGHSAIYQVFRADDWLCAIVDDSVLVLDADTPEAEAAAQAIFAAHDVQPNLTVKTRNGFHHYFRRAPGSYAKMQGHSSDKHPERIDIRTARSANDGRSVIVLPPSPGKAVQINEADTVRDLVEVGQDFIDAIFRHNGQDAPRPPEPRTEATRRRTVGSSEAAEILSHIPPDCGYSDWLTVLMGVHERFDGSDDGLHLIDEWSSGAGNYCGASELEYKYQTFSTRADGVTFSSVCKLAEQHGADLAAIARRHTDQGTVRIIDLRTHWDREPAPPEFIVERYLPAGNVTLLSGHGGAGKTSLALAMAAHVAAGVPFAGLNVIRSPVAFGSLEDGPDLVHLRLRRIVEAYRLDAAEVLENFTLIDVSTGDAVLAREDGGILHSTKTFTAVSDAASSHRLIIIDNASDAYGGNENARAEVRGFMRMLAGLARDNHAAVVLLAHIDKASAKIGGSGQNYSGSTAWHNSARSRLSLALEEDNIHLYHEKCNLGPLADPLPIQFNNRGVPMPLPRLSAPEQSVRDLVPAFEAAESSGAIVYDNLNAGAYSAYATLERFPEYPRRYQGKAGRKLAAKGITQLIRDGVLVREQYRKADRKTASRIVLAQPLPQEADE